ncbi:P-loop containing nucleoside triphosphate hydrolase protein [Jackrogersella minutella]|nr:P-loop containing nucleoside triphosphate hydrolase protein [Jackrogersella minutella]
MKPSAAEDVPCLPELHFDINDSTPDIALSQECYKFSAKTLATALSRGCNHRSIKTYVQRFPQAKINIAMDHHVKNHRVITYAIDTGDAEIIHLLLQYNPNVDCTDFVNVPLLAFAIMRALRVGRSNVEVIRLLLSHGADPRVIPEEMWRNYMKTPTNIAERVSGEVPEPEKWCTEKYRLTLAKTLDLTTRYYLWRASRIRTPKQRMLRIAGAHNMTALLKLPYQIIGQELAVKLVVETIYAHVAQDTEKPLVMAFSGLSGHGKTELATQMGSLLSIPITELDCTHSNSQTALLGSTYGYSGNTHGAPLNNFLVENRGSRCVVFLDEFDKTGQDVWNALLKVMDTGTYRDRREGRDQTEINCRKVIWILACNYGDSTISKFHAKHLATCKNGDVGEVSLKSLQEELEELFMSRFSAAVTGRIDEIVPFIPFNKGEQAVVAHKFLLAFQDEAKRPIDEGAKKLVGNADVRIVEDGKVCELIARRSYKKELGARSIYKGVRGLRRAFTLQYSDTDQLVTDSTSGKDPEKYVIQLNPLTEDQEEISIFREEADEQVDEPNRWSWDLPVH